MSAEALSCDASELPANKWEPADKPALQVFFGFRVPSWNGGMWIMPSLVLSVSSVQSVISFCLLSNSRPLKPPALHSPPTLLHPTPPRGPAGHSLCICM